MFEAGQSVMGGDTVHSTQNTVHSTQYIYRKAEIMRQAQRTKEHNFASN